jgi:RimJ/RimL family protein N-acetyltransferase
VPNIPALETPLTDGHVVVRLAAERDIPEVLIAHQDDPELHIRRGLKKPPSGAELGRQMEAAASLRANGISETLTIVAPGSDECLGQIIIHEIDWEHLRAELGIWLAPKARGRGLASGALRLTAGWLLGAWGLERIQLRTEADNEEMLLTARAAGFVDEGVFRAQLREQGARVDVAVMSLLASDGR